MLGWIIRNTGSHNRSFYRGVPATPMETQLLSAAAFGDVELVVAILSSAGAYVDGRNVSPMMRSLSVSD